MDKTLIASDLISLYVESISKADTASFRSLWSGKDNTLVSIGRLYRGVDEIVDDFLLGTVGRKYTSIKLLTDDIKIIDASDSLVIVIFRFHADTVLRKNDKPYGFQGLETQIIVKTDKGWKFQHIHYSKRSD